MRPRHTLPRTATCSWCSSTASCCTSCRRCSRQRFVTTQSHAASLPSCNQCERGVCRCTPLPCHARAVLQLRALEEELGCGDAWHRLGLPPVASSSHAMGWVSTPAAVAEWKRRSSGADGMYPVHLIALESLRTASPEIDALLAPRTSAHHARSVEELNASVLVPCALINALNVGQLMVGFFTLFGQLLEWSLTSISVRTASFTSRPTAVCASPRCPRTRRAPHVSTARPLLLCTPCACACVCTCARTTWCRARCHMRVCP